MNPLLRFLTIITVLSICCASASESSNHTPYLIVLGNVQDAGSPHMACKKSCCAALFQQPDPQRKVVSLGLVDRRQQKTYCFEATPDFPVQAKLLKESADFNDQEVPDGIFLTHAHIGHYTGLMYLGREAMNAKAVPVYAMPKMKTFLEENGPWSQLVDLENIAIQALQNQQSIAIDRDLKVTPFIVPHRDEFSETVGYRIEGPNHSALFIPDIDKWGKWSNNIVEEVAKVDYAFIDGTFFDAAEINYRNIEEIPHPFVIESMEKMAQLSIAEKRKIHFIHFNHTNPLLDPNSAATQQVLEAGFRIARLGDTFPL